MWYKFINSRITKTLLVVFIFFFVIWGLFRINGVNPTPFSVVPKSMVMMIFGQIDYVVESNGKTVKANGKEYKIFRHAVNKKSEVPKGVFCVWFTPKMDDENTIKLSNLTKLGFMGFPGWRSKRWMLDKSNHEFGGIYEFDTLEQAKVYETSFAMKFSHWHSQEGKFRTETFNSNDFPYEILE
jgi:hypothetical protein